MNRHLYCLWLLAGLLVVGGCTSPWQDPEAMVGYQHRNYGYLKHLYPVGTPRQDVIESSVGIQEAHIDLPMSGVDLELYGDTDIGVDLELFTRTVRRATGQDPHSVDVLKFFGGSSALGIEAHYVFYDENDCVLYALGSPWED
ncbi:MAG: hypothetical protein IT445_20090 [Phycisphaeraceae bacterium]|nr:hypothetical protein [Phycisphaeraceae bacterium]